MAEFDGKNRFKSGQVKTKMIKGKIKNTKTWQI